MPRRSALFIATALCAVGLAAASPARSHTPTAAYSFGRDGVLGTSLDVTFTARSAADAQKAEAAVLAEVERLRRIISSYDDSSEVSRLASTGRVENASPDLITVLDEYTYWSQRSDRAYSPRVGALTELWKKAEISGHVPAESTLMRAAIAAREPGWQVDRSSRVVT
ncbi:MAG TPA: FAD:protein FMN transferase, partial [Gemmatimonadaceae bacterium]|nr:FAD:protein FMN transferase [Gemmatimonadaceae bacterium]